MELTAIIMTAYLLLCGLLLLVLCKRSRHPLRTGIISIAGGLLALGGVSISGLAVPVNLYTLVISAVFGIPGVAGLTALSFI